MRLPQRACRYFRCQACSKAEELTAAQRHVLIRRVDQPHTEITDGNADVDLVVADCH